MIARSESRHHSQHTRADHPTAGAGTDDGVPGIRLGALAGRLQVTPRSVTEVVDALESLDLVARSPDPADRRAVQVHLTDHGRQTARAIRSARRAQTESILDELSPEERAQLRATLLTLIEAAEHSLRATR
jgi:DNA-binding MarR family transcriptional regulator